jgi:hypothetical protein
MTKHLIIVTVPWLLRVLPSLLRVSNVGTKNHRSFSRRKQGGKSPCYFQLLVLAENMEE